jgi:Alcohol dehydrogenase GroES-like domain
VGGQHLRAADGTMPVRLDDACGDAVAEIARRLKLRSSLIQPTSASCVIAAVRSGWPLKKKGERVVVPFTITCGECEQCKRGNFSVCETTNRNKKMADKVFGHATAGLFGYTHLTGGYPGGQAEYLRVPFADTTHIKVPDSLTDEQALFLGDIFPTGWQAAVQCDIEPTDTVVVWAAARWARCRCAARCCSAQNRLSQLIGCPSDLIWRRQVAPFRSTSSKKALLRF